jgi:cleavage and polyadenylation specificity factor subunit 1
MGVVIQQGVKKDWQPLVFSKKLNSAQQKYSAYDCKLLAIYEDVKHFRHMLEARHLIIFTNHKPITYAFQQKRDKFSPQQFNHLILVAQFKIDIRHISGQDNVAADALSRVESVTAPPSCDALGASQDSDELRTVLGSTTALRLEKLPISRPMSPSTATRLPGELDRTCQLPYDSKCSSPSMICRTQAPKEQRSWSQSILCGQA